METLSAYLNTYLGVWQGQILDPDRIPLAIMGITLAALCGAVSGPLAGNANPFLWLFYDKILGSFGERLDKVHRTPADLAMRGFAVTIIALLIALALGKFYSRLVFEKPFYGITEILLLSTLITCGTVWYALLKLYFALEKKQPLKGAYYIMSRSTRTNLNATDDFSITRAGMNYAARSFDKGLVAPVFWYLFGGLPLALIYAAIAALSWRFGKDGFSKGFGTIPLMLEKLMGIVPSLFAAFLMTAATIITPTAAIHKGLAAWLGHKNRAPYEQGGYTLSSMAWALNVSIGGASQDLSGSALHNVWVGPAGATAKIDHGHLRRAIYINFAATILFMAALCGAYLWSGLR